ncbi:MAG: hypothetical protein WC418_00550, partial [Candidatus Omnitrophota bacterium]
VFAEKTTMSVNPTPVTEQVLGTDEATLSPAKFPKFSNEGDNAACKEYLEAEYPDGLSLAPICTVSKDGDGTKIGECLDYTLIPGMKKTGFVIPEAYRKTATVLVTWTIRVEGYGTEGYVIWPKLCSSWHGTSEQSFPEDVVKTRLYVNDTLLGQDAVMTIPAGNSVTLTQVNDPTHTGSYLVKPGDFGGELPATLDIELRWINETSMKIVSPASMRSMLITLTPIGDIKE